MHSYYTPWELELLGPRNGLNIDSRSSPGVRSAPFFALIPNSLTTRGALLEVPRGLPRGAP
eukprot:1058585-Alexandrium_andersonii.AAC.1